MFKKFLKLASLSLVTVLMMSALVSCAFLDNLMGKGGDDKKEEEETDSYTITFDFGEGVSTEGFETSVKVLDNETITLPTPVKEGHTFLGWFVGDKQITATDTFTASTTLVAKYEVTKVTVKFFDHLGNLMSEQVIDWGTAAKAPQLEVAIVAGAPFKEWDTDYSCVKEDIVVRPIYARKTYTVSFNVGNGATAVADQSVYYGDKPVSPEEPYKMGYSLVGWYLDPELTTICNFDTAFDADTTVYASFIADYIPISTAAELIAMQPGSKYVLLADIDLGGNEWHPIENFTGALDGNGHKIFNFTMASTGEYLGFVNQNSGVIKNLTFDKFRIEYQPANAAAYVSVIAAKNDGTIKNCQVLNNESVFTVIINWVSVGRTISAYVSPISGYNTGVIKDCANNVDVSITTATGSHGGSYSYHNNTTISLCAAGVVGYNLGTVSKAETYGKISITQTSNGTSGYGYCYNYYYVGGLIGSNAANAKLSESASYAQITANFSGGMNTKLAYIGVIAGTNYSAIDDCLATGTIAVTNESTSLTGAIGGAVGVNVTECNINNVYADVDVTVGDNVSACVAGYVAKNEAGATLTKAIYTGNISIGANVTEYGFICASKAGEIIHCYYDATSVLKQSDTQLATGTCTAGDAKATIDLLSEEFLTKTLQWSLDIWSITDGSAPTLNAFSK